MKVSEAAVEVCICQVSWHMMQSFRVCECGKIIRVGRYSAQVASVVGRVKMLLQRLDLPVEITGPL
jgi:hypothetical protein